MKFSPAEMGDFRRQLRLPWKGEELGDWSNRVIFHTIISQDTYIENVDSELYNFVKEDPLEYNFPLYNWVEGPHGDPTNTQTMTIDEAKNGFYLSFNKSFITIFPS